MITDLDLPQEQSRAASDPVVATDRIAMAIRAWLDDVQEHGSPRTLTAYADILGSFRAFIQAHGYDLADSHTPQLAQVAKTWAELRAGEEHITQEERRGVAPATYNLRLATISSFCAYANRFGWLTVANPIDRVRRARNDTYERAEALSVAAVTQALRQIDHSTERGLRDYALLTIALVTGRRLSEMAGMRWGHVHPQHDRVLLHFPRTKGDKVMRDLLPPNVSRALLVWLETFYDQQLGDLPHDAPVWVVLKTSTKARRGAPATIQTRGYPSPVPPAFTSSIASRRTRYRRDPDDKLIAPACSCCHCSGTTLGSGQAYLTGEHRARSTCLAPTTAPWYPNGYQGAGAMLHKG